ncbi:MAG: hypothetical protein ACPGWR_19405 [Ardenticatenaceae bacterium]
MVLKVNNLSLPLQYTPTGPFLLIKDRFLEPIQWVINSAVSDEAPQIADLVARGEDVSFLMGHAIRPTPEDDDLDELRALWRELTGSDPGEDVYILGTGFTYHEVVMPRQTLLEIIQTLKKLRAEFPEPPPAPWLFQRIPFDLGVEDGEKELVCELEERAAIFKRLLEQEQTALAVIPSELLRDFSAAGLFSEAYFKRKKILLELWSCPTLLTYHKAAIAFLNHFRSQLEQVIPPVTPGAPPLPVLSASIWVDELEVAYAQEGVRQAKEKGNLAFFPCSHALCNGSGRQACSGITVLKVDRVSLPLIWTATGPNISAQEKLLAPIAWVVNLEAANGQLAGKIAPGEGLSRLARRPTATDDLSEARLRWQQLAAQEPSKDAFQAEAVLAEDVYLLGEGFSEHEILFPRQTLSEAIEALKELRAEWKTPLAPWLFRRKPYHHVPTEGEKEFVCELEERAHAFWLMQQEQINQNEDENGDQTAFHAAREALLPDLEAAGLFSEAYFTEKQKWLETWSCPTLLTYHKAALAFLKHFRNQESPLVPRGARPVPVLSVSISIDDLKFPYIPEAATPISI